MLTYFVILTIPLLLSWSPSSPNRGISIGLLAYFLILLVFMGLRYEVGPDWARYGELYFDWQYDDLEIAALSREPGFFVLNKMSDAFGFGFQGVIFVCALVFLMGMFAYATQTANAWIALAVITPYLIFVIAMSGIRQAAAMGIIYFLLAKWTQVNFIIKLTLIVGAATVHNSALFALVLVMFEDRKWIWPKIFFSGLLILYLMRSGNVTDAMDAYRTEYVEHDSVSGGAFFHVLLSAFPAALFLYNRERIAAAGWANPQVTAGSLAAILALPLVLVASTAVDRLALYFSYVQMWAYPALVASFVGPRSNGATRENWLAMISSIVMLVFFGFFIFGNHVSGYVPYKNVLID